MDLVIDDTAPTDAERDAVDAVLGPPHSGWDGAGIADPGEEHVAYGGRAARAQRHLLLPVLHAVQARAGWISPGALNYVCRRLTIPPAEAHGVATFYALFSTEPQPPVVAHVCVDVACQGHGASTLCAAMRERLGPAGGHRGGHGIDDAVGDSQAAGNGHAAAGRPTNGHAGPGGDMAPRAGADGTANGRANGHPLADGTAETGPIWLESPCLGMCERAPAAMVTIAGERPAEFALAPASAESIARAIAGEGMPTPPPDVPQARAGTDGEDNDDGLRLLKRVGRADPHSIDSYRAHGGYKALRAALDLGPAGVLREVSDAKLLGRGGAAFPTGRKWEAVSRNPRRPHYLICNADESEPGTFKDRVILENDPFAVIEAMTIAAFATGCAHGYLYLRGEYPVAWERLAEAITQARTRGFLGAGILGTELSFDIELRKGAGAYICGEETALFNSLEGYRGEPRNKPPFPVDSGLFRHPTVVNNVETLINVLDIVTHGGPAYAAIGTGSSTGTRLFCLSGAVARPGLYEVPMGITLARLLEMAGGVAGDRPLRTILLGGAAGRFVTPDELGVELSFEATREAGVTMGSGVVVVFDDTIELAPVLRRIAAFFRDESCGQCVPCRVGTVRQEEALARLDNGISRGGVAGERALLDEIIVAMRDASICGLGQTAGDAIESALTKLDVFADAPRGDRG